MIPNNVKDICELFDCQVCKDLAEKPRFKKKVVNDEDYIRNLTTCYYIGEYTDLSAGLHGYDLTEKHLFFTMEALERYCHSTKGREEINQNAGKTFTDWDTEKQEWREEK